MLAEWRSFQLSLEGRAEGPLPIRIRVTPAERHEVTSSLPLTTTGARLPQVQLGSLFYVHIKPDYWGGFCLHTA